MAQKETLPSAISVNDTSIPFTEVQERFGESNYGKILDANIRFQWFKEESISNTAWESLLGPDVNNLRHLNYSYRVARRFVARNHNPDFARDGSVSPEAVFTLREKELFLFTSIVHDWGEAKTGDIQYGTKTDKDEAEEYEMLQQAIYELLPTADTEAKTTIGNNVISILSDTDTKLGKAFHTMEQVGYVRTGLVAWERSKHLTDQDQRHGLHMLSLNVVGRHIPDLVAHATIYPAVSSFLQAGERRFTEIYENLADLPINGHAQDSEKKRADFVNSHTHWQNFRNK